MKSCYSTWWRTAFIAVSSFLLASPAWSQQLKFVQLDKTGSIYAQIYMFGGDDLGFGVLIGSGSKRRIINCSNDLKRRHSTKIKDALEGKFEYAAYYRGRPWVLISNPGKQKGLVGLAYQSEDGVWSKPVVIFSDPINHSKEHKYYILSTDSGDHIRVRRSTFIKGERQSKEVIVNVVQEASGQIQINLCEAKPFIFKMPEIFYNTVVVATLDEPIGRRHFILYKQPVRGGVQRKTYKLFTSELDGDTVVRVLRFGQQYVSGASMAIDPANGDVVVVCEVSTDGGGKLSSFGISRFRGRDTAAYSINLTAISPETRSRLTNIHGAGDTTDSSSPTYKDPRRMALKHVIPRPDGTVDVVTEEAYSETITEFITGGKPMDTRAVTMYYNEDVMVATLNAQGAIVRDWHMQKSQMSGATDRTLNSIVVWQGPEGVGYFYNPRPYENSKDRFVTTGISQAYVSRSAPSGDIFTQPIPALSELCITPQDYRQTGTHRIVSIAKIGRRFHQDHGILVITMPEEGLIPPTTQLEVVEPLAR